MVSLLHYGNAHRHLLRIATAEQQPAVEEFLIGHLNYLHQLALFGNPKKEKSLETRIATSSDGSTARQFWNVAPYIYAELRERGFSNTKALEVILDWSGAREQIPGQRDNSHYPGMKKMMVEYPELERSWYLTRDEDNPTHQLARKVGRHIADFIRKTYSMADEEPRFASKDDKTRVLLSERESELIKRKLNEQYLNKQRLDIDGVRLTFLTEDGSHLGFEMKAVEREDDRVVLISNDIDYDVGGPQILEFLNEHGVEEIKVV